MKLFSFVMVLGIGLASIQGQNSVEELLSMDGSDADRFFSSLRDGEFIYLAGQTSSSDFPVSNAVQPSFGGNDDDAEPGDMIIVKYNSDTRAVEWATYFGGSGSDAATGLSLDVNGSLVVSGHTTSTDFPTMNPIQSVNGGKSDAVIVKLSASGDLLFSTYLGGVEDDQFSDTARDTTNNINIFAGFTASIDFPLPANNPETADVEKPEAGNADYIVVALNDDNTLQWVTIPDTGRNFPGNDVASAVAVDNFGNILVTGYTESPNFVDNTLFGGFRGGQELFLAKIQGSNADRLDSVLIGGSGDESGNDIVIANGGLAVVIGQTNSPDIAMRASPILQTTYGGGDSDVLLVSFDYDEFRMSRAATYFGGSGDDFGRTGILDPNGFFHIAGATSSTDLPFDLMPANQPIQAANGGGAFDGFLLNIKSFLGFSRPSISFSSATYYGGTGLEAITTIGINPAVPAPDNFFDPYLVYLAGFSSPPAAALQRRNMSRIPGLEPNSFETLAFLAAISGVVQVLPDLTVDIEDRAPVKRNQEEKVTIFVGNIGLAQAENPRIKIDPSFDNDTERVVTAEIVSVKYQGVTLQVNPDTGFYTIPAENNSVLSGQFLEIEVTLKSLPQAEEVDPPGVDLEVEVVTSSPEISFGNNFNSITIPLKGNPDLAINLLSATQDGIGVTPKTATFIFEVTNVGTGVADTAFIDLQGENLRNVTYSLDGAPAVNIGGIDSVVAVPIGSLDLEQKVEVQIQGELVIQKNVNSQVNATTKLPDDLNTENNSAVAEITPPTELDYSVTILEGYTQYIVENESLVPVLFTDIELKIVLPDDIPLDQVPRAVLTIHHAGNNRSIEVKPINVGQCSAVDSVTTECSFFASDFFEEGVTPGLIKISISDYLEPLNLQMPPKAIFSVAGDGDNPDVPNNYAEIIDDLAKKGKLSLTRVSHEARTIQLPSGELAVVATQRIRVRNDGPGIVENISVSLIDRSKFSNIGGRIFEPARVIEGDSNGVTIDTNTDEETVKISSLAANSEIIIELHDQLPISADSSGEVLGESGILGNIRLSAPSPTDLTGSGVDDVLGNLESNSVFFPEDQSPDVAVNIVNQRYSVQIVNGSRQPELVTELSISNIGTALASDVQLTLNASGVISGGIINRPPNPIDVPYTQPGLPDDPQTRLVSLGDIESGASINLELKDVVADPGIDHLISISATATHNSFDANVSNNKISRDNEYQALIQTLDYGVDFLIQTPERLMIDGFLVPVVRTRLEFTISGDNGAESIPPFNLLFVHPGDPDQVRLIPKDPNTPVPISGFQCQSTPGVATACDFSAAIARDFLVEFIDRVVTPTESSVTQSRADITGDGETPSNENNNRATSSVEYNAMTVADVSVTQIDEGGPSVKFGFRKSVTDQFLVRNLSSSETARDVLISVEYDFDPVLPAGAPMIIQVTGAGGDITTETVQCLTSGNPVGCSIADIEPSGERVVSITSFFQDLPINEDEHPSIVRVRLKAQAAGEVTLANNQAVIFHNTEIPNILVEPVEFENGSKVFVFRILKPKSAGIVEKSENLLGPWVEVEGNSIPIEGDSGYVRARPASGN